jgi:8-oxo-dGTP pyrophosphatase MutT (NUDIX family)
MSESEDARRHGAIVDGLRARLRSRARAVFASPIAIECAVLVPLIATADGYGVVFTLRSEHLPNHKGQVSFPGGKRQPADDATLLATALREAREEIGIPADTVDVLGALDDVTTMATDFVITPFVGVVPPDTRYRINPLEVDDVFAVDLRDLADPRHRAKTVKEWRGQSFEMDAITAGPHVIWGATHRITLNLLECVAETPR